MTTSHPLPGPDDPGRLHPLTLVAGPIRQLGGWIVPLIIALILGTRSEGAFGGFGFLVLILAGTVASQVIQFLRLRWWVDHDAFHLRTGLLQVENRTVPLDRIHNVDVTEPIFARLLGMAEVRIESAGSSAADVNLRYVAADQALTIRDGLRGLAGAAAPTESEEATPEDRILVHTPTSELLVAGATNNRIGALAVAAAAVVGVLFEAGVDPEALFDVAGDLVRPGVWLVVIVIVAAIVVGWLVSIAESVLRFHDFTLTLHEDEARRTHGLLSRSSGRIPLARVQTVRVEQPFLRRWLHRSTIVADTAGSVSAGISAGTGTVSPIEPDGRVPELVSTMLRRPGTDATGLHPVSRLAIRRAFVRAIVPIVLLAAVPAILFSPWWALVAAGLAIPAWFWARARWAAIGHRLDEDLLVVRSGVFTRRTWFVPTAKVQAVGVRRTPFQRRLGLADLRVESAASADGTVVVIDLELDTAHALAERLSDRSSATAFVSDGV